MSYKELLNFDKFKIVCKFHLSKEPVDILEETKEV